MPINTSTPAAIMHSYTMLKWDTEIWYSYTIQGLRNEISVHTRKDQRYYQRKFCNHYSRLQRFRTQHAELFI